ncbi:polysaccharide deacetylase family protein [Chitinophagaceae bacterium MMS25-I14]
MVLMYHNVGAERGFNTVAAELFEKQVDYIAARYKVVSVDEYVENIIRNGIAAPGQVVFTFDDAYVGYEQYALPVLEKRQLPSALFVCTGYIGRSNEWDAADKRSSIMDISMLGSLVAHPLITIGSHTVNHRSLTTLDQDDLAGELTASKAFLEQLTGREIHYFSYPYGQPHLNLNKMTGQEVQKAGYTAAFSTNFRNRNNKSELFSLSRLDITPEDEMDIFKKKLADNNFYSVKQQVKNLYSFLKQSI